MSNIDIIGAGVAGLWSAFLLQKAGHQVTIFERQSAELTASCSYKAGGMLAPYCEAVDSEVIIHELGIQSLELWKTYFPNHITQKGSLVLAYPKDYNQLEHFSRHSAEYTLCDDEKIASLEPDLKGRFTKGLFYPHESHLQPRVVIDALQKVVTQAGGKFYFETPYPEDRKPDIVIDATGLDAKKHLEIRGVRGEMLVIHAPEIHLRRPIRLLHLRHPLYIVPRPNYHYMIGATTIETEKETMMSVRSAGELLTQAYHLHPAFAEAEIIEMNAGIRPALIDNIPQVIKQQGRYFINGLYRHGWMVAPALATHLVQQISLDV